MVDDGWRSRDAMPAGGGRSAQVPEKANKEDESESR